MSLISDASLSWSAPLTLTSDEIWQARQGGVFLSTTASPDAEDGVLLREGEAVRVSAGLTLRYRASSAQGAVIVHEVA